jgi:SAM-dependent methyltransferase
LVTKDFYTSEQYLKKNPDWHVAASPWKTGSILQMLQRNRLTPKTICEIGCGAGEILRLLQQQMPADSVFDGYEISPLAYKLAQERENERLHFHLADFLEEQNAYFDLILMIDVLEHFENCFSVLRDIKPRSDYKIFLIPLDISVITVLRNELIDYRHATGHLHFFTRDVILEVLQDAGYDILDTFYTLPPLDTSPWNRQPQKIARKGIRLVKRGLQRLPGQLLYTIHKDFAVRFWGGWKLVVLAK